MCPQIQTRVSQVVQRSQHVGVVEPHHEPHFVCDFFCKCGVRRRMVLPMMVLKVQGGMQVQGAWCTAEADVRPVAGIVHNGMCLS